MSGKIPTDCSSLSWWWVTFCWKCCCCCWWPRCYWSDKQMLPPHPPFTWINMSSLYKKEVCVKQKSLLVHLTPVSIKAKLLSYSTQTAFLASESSNNKLLSFSFLSRQHKWVSVSCMKSPAPLSCQTHDSSYQQGQRGNPQPAATWR